MDDFSSYNQIDILPSDQQKTTFIFPWGTFSYRKLPFGLKNAWGTFQWAMSYAFHDIKQIVDPYLDDLPTHYARREDHIQHLWSIFLRCHHYNIRLNPHKCIFLLRLDGCLASSFSNMGFGLIP